MALTDFVAGQILTAQQLDDSFAAVDWNENVIINGAIQVAQRSTSVAGITASGYYTADRFAVGASSLGTWTQSVEADAPTGSGFRNSLKMLCTTADASPAAGDIMVLEQKLEGLNVQQFLKGTASAKTFNLSFWVKANVTGTFIAELFDGTNTRSVSAAYTISASGTWEKKTITFPADTTGALANNNTNALSCIFYLGAGSTFTSGTLQTTWANLVNANRAPGQVNVSATINNYWQVTGIQLQPERFSQFAFLDYGTVLAQCERYFQKFVTRVEQNNGSTTSTYVDWQFKTSMRTTPTVINNGGAATVDATTENRYYAYRTGGNTVAIGAGSTANAEL